MRRKRKYILALLAISTVVGTCWGLVSLLKGTASNSPLTVMVTNGTENSLYVRVLLLNPKVPVDASDHDMPDDAISAGLLSAYETRNLGLALNESPETLFLVAYAQTIPVDGNDAKYAMQFFTSPLEAKRDLGQLRIEDKIAIEFRRDQLQSLGEVVARFTQ